MEDTDTTSRLFQVHKTICKMLTTRGFHLSEAVTGISARDFKDKCAGGADRKALQMRVYRPGERHGGMLIYWANEEKLGASGVQEFFKEFEEQQADEAILIVQKTITPFARKGIPEECRKRKQQGKHCSVEIFLENELVVDITEHELVPKHEVMSPEEKQELLKKYHVSEAQLPRILVTDPVARYLGLRRGQCVRIIRNSETAGRYVSYRICV